MSSNDSTFSTVYLYPVDSYQAQTPFVYIIIIMVDTKRQVS